MSTGVLIGVVTCTMSVLASLAQNPSSEAPSIVFFVVYMKGAAVAFSSRSSMARTPFEP